MMNRTTLAKFAEHIRTEVPYDDNSRLIADAVLDVQGKLEGKSLSRNRRVHFLIKCGLWTSLCPCGCNRKLIDAHGFDPRYVKA